MGINIIVTIIIVGAVAGFLANMILGRKSKSIVQTIVIGIIGGFVGNFLFSILGITIAGLLGTIISATLGAVVLLLLVGYFKKAL